jgi:anti-anti-sigma factor
MPLTVTVEARPGGTYFVIRPSGSIDATTFQVLAKEVDAVLNKPPNLIIFDMDQVGYVSSAGIGVVLAAEKAMKKAGGKALLVNLKPQIRKVFDIVQALPPQQLFNNTRDLDEYLAEMQRQVREGPPA